MADQRITITIDENGQLQAHAEGFQGEICLNELEALLVDLAIIMGIKKTDEFFQKVTAKTQAKQSLKGGKS